jgi:hypothetical protein
MRAKSSSYKLEDAIVDKHGKPVEEEIVPPSERVLRPAARRGKRAAVFLQVPGQIMARLALHPHPIWGPAWDALCILQQLEFRAERKGGFHTFSNNHSFVHVSKHLKFRALDVLVEREFILPYTRIKGKSPRVRLNMRLQK